MQVASPSKHALFRQRSLKGRHKARSPKSSFSLMRGGFATPGASSVKPAGAQSRSIPAAMRSVHQPTMAPPPSPGASGGMAPASKATNSDAFKQLSKDAANSLWYGGTQRGGASVTGIYSEKASFNGQAGIGHPKYATTATGEDMVISVTGLHGKNPKPTQVMALDSGKILQRNGGVWPGTPEAMKEFLQKNPDVILANVKTNPPQAARLSGVPAGTKVTILTGAEALFGNPPKSPAPSQAMITNLSQLPANARAMLPEGSITASTDGGAGKAMAQMQAQMMMQRATEQMARDAARQNANQIAQNSAMQQAASEAQRQVSRSASSAENTDSTASGIGK